MLNFLNIRGQGLIFFLQKLNLPSRRGGKIYGTDNDSKHTSIESLKFYKSNLISIKLGPTYSPDLKLYRESMAIIKRR